MKSLKRIIAPAIVGAGLLVAGIGLAPANASPISPPPSPSITSAEVAYAQTVAQFAATHSAPVVTSKDPATYALQTQAAYEYWKALPLQALYGQYGCTVSGKNVSIQVGDDGVSRATADWANSCPAGVDSSIIRKLAPRPEALALASKSSPAVVSPQYVVTSCSGILSSGKHCIYYETTTGEHDFQYIWYGSGSITGHVRAGQPGFGQPCGNGTFLGNSADHTIGNGSSIIEVVFANYSSQFSNSFYPPTPGGLRSRYCASM